MSSPNQVLQYGDMVVLYGGYQTMNQLKIEKGKIFNSKKGHFPHDTMVGKKYGDKIHSTQGAGWLTLLPLSTSLWTLSCPRKTEILYQTDISIIVLRLRLKPGCQVVESGTGSGSLSIHIMQAIAPHGHLYTFEFHDKRAEGARETFKENKVDHLVTVGCRDVCKEGFGLPTEFADAVFLDLPSPWTAIQAAKECLKSGSYLCSFSPCMEQVQKTCEALSHHKFTDLTTLECLQRPWDVQSIQLPDCFSSPMTEPKKRKYTENEMSVVTKPLPESRGHTGYLTFAKRLH